MSQEKPHKSFWSTAPGTVAAIAAMVTAVAGAIPVIVAIRGGGEGKPAGSATPTPTVSASAEGSLSPGGAPDEHKPGAAAPPVIASPGSLDFGRVAPNLASSTQTVQFVNTGQDPVTVGRIRVVGPGEAAFTIAEGSCKEGEELAPDASCDLKLRFAPSASGSQQATLVVERSPGDPVQVPLSGSAGLL